MKKLKVFGFALLIALTSAALSQVSSQSANGATSSAKCAAAKTQVRAFEKLEKPFSLKYAPVNGKWSWTFATPNTDQYIDLQKRIVDLQVKMFTFDRANLECFTPTQKEYAVSSLKIWKEIQANLAVRPDWLAGFTFVAIIWDSIYTK